MGETWVDRLRAEIEARGLVRDDLDRAAGLPKGRVRRYLHEGAAHPRGDVIARYARALGVEELWLRDGTAPRTPGEQVGADTADGDEVLARRHFARRLALARARAGIETPESACLGLTIRPQRWRALESGQASPTLVELRLIADRLAVEAGWLVSASSGHDHVAEARELQRLRGAPPPE